MQKVTPRLRALGMGMLAAAVLTACGGGGGGSEAPPPVVQPTAIPDNLAITAPAVVETSGATAFTSSAAGLSGLTFAWTFGDGTSSTDASPKHDYTKAGDFEVSLKVSNSAGTSKEVKFKVAVNNRALVKSLSCSAENQGGWCWQAPRPSGNSISDFYFLSSQLGWTTGDAGEILKTTDGGKNWTRQSSGISAMMTTVRFADANNGWALGGYGAVLHTTDGGAHWSMQSVSPADGFAPGLMVVNASTAVLTSPSSVITATTDGGASWSQVNLSGYSTSVTPDGTVWAVNYAGLRKSTDMGKSWTTVRDYPSQGTPTLIVKGSLVLVIQQIYAYDPVKGPTYTPVVHRSTDAGATWELLTAQGLPSSNYGVYGADFFDANNGVMWMYSALYRTTDGGRTWAPMDVPAGAQTYSIDIRALLPGVLYRRFYDQNSQYVHQVSEDAGTTWRNIAVPTRYSSSSGWPAQQLQRLDAKNWVALAENNVWVSSDGMASWSIVRGQSSSTSPRNYNALWFQDANRGLALTQYGELLETKNGGLDWAVKLAGLQGYGQGARIQFVDANKGWLLSGDGRLYMSTDGGERWSAPLTSLAYTFRSVHFVDASNGFAVGADNNSYQRRLLATTDGGQNWTMVAPLTEDFAALHFTSALQGVMVGGNGRIVSTADGGKTWVGRYSGTNTPLTSIAASEAGLWVVGQYGAMLNSKDGGVTWTLSTPLTTASLQKIRFLDSRQGWIVGTGGTVLSTQDGGKTWKSQEAGTRVTLTDVFFADSRSGWISGENGTLLVTGTGGN
ncbi:YCF48-related protein [Roseateles sp. NT4]|uniref:YCF48-related protein n=1 Tax=Roseateles sp. NT4 TaxID=3453715 RepID=UPI003EEEEA13